MTPRKIKVLVVDDSAVVRRVLSDSISQEPDLEVIGAAPDPYVARDKILALEPDVLTLDIEMPRMDGLTFLSKLMHFHPLPVVVVSSVGQVSCDVALEALRLGAVEVLAKPSGPYSVGELGHVLGEKIRAAFAARLPKRVEPAQPAGAAPITSPPLPAPVPFRAAAGLIVIGASTGGTQAIEEVLLQIPERCPPILIAQHIPPVFSASFATRLNSICRMEVREARDGDLVTPGRALVAPGDFHMTLVRRDGVSRVAVAGGPRVHYQRPAVDVLFRSVAEARVPKTVGVLLTGMGSDGAQGLLEMRHAGAFTIAQDEASCVVFGMPKAAIEQGAVQKIVPLSQIASQVLSTLSERPEGSIGT